jgi:prepilin-type N-terminal cleavage/methylation domain-containing protein
MFSKIIIYLRQKFYSKERVGFTIVELLVVIALISVFSLVLVSNFPQSRLQLSLSRVSYKFEQDVRRTQGRALSSEQYKDSGGTLQTVFGYGVYVDTLSNNKQYIIYADKTGNQIYDVTDYVIDTVNFSSTEPGIVIKQINNIVGTNVNIDFIPPNFNIIITPVAVGNRVDVVFALASDLTKTRTVSVYQSGLVEVQ